jgi:hypothetical protein
VVNTVSKWVNGCPKGQVLLDSPLHYAQLCDLKQTTEQLVISLRTLSLVALQTALTLTSQHWRSPYHNNTFQPHDQGPLTFPQQSPIPTGQHILLSTCIHVSISQIHLLQFVDKQLRSFFPDMHKAMATTKSKSGNMALKLVKGVILAHEKVNLTKQLKQEEKLQNKEAKKHEKELPKVPEPKQGATNNPKQTTPVKRQNDKRDIKLGYLRSQVVKSLMHLLDISQVLQNSCFQHPTERMPQMIIADPPKMDSAKKLGKRPVTPTTTSPPIPHYNDQETAEYNRRGTWRGANAPPISSTDLSSSILDRVQDYEKKLDKFKPSPQAAPTKGKLH